MSQQSTIIQDFKEVQPHVGEFRRIIRVMASRKVVVIGFVIIVLMVIMAAFAPWLAPYDPNWTSLPKPSSNPARLTCRDRLAGRDTLSRIIYGSRASLLVGIVSITIAASIGMALGLIAGYFGGMTYTIIMRFIDALMAFPMILMALC
jgi:ABC-type dipeptide/oligopeptide/nickel transport system permease subunit